MVVRTYYLILGVLLSLLAGCQSIPTPSERYQGQTPDQIFVAGDTYLAKHNYGDTTVAYEALDALYPYNEHAEVAQLNLIYAYYMNDENPSASAAAERYIRLYPRAPRVDYAYYMKGLADFYQDRGWFQRYFPADLSLRDPGTMRESFTDFATLVKLFPQSPYADDARRRMIFLKNTFAQTELNNAEYYFVRGSYVAAANRASEVLKRFDGTPAVQPALKILVQSYQKLGQTESAARAQALIDANHPVTTSPQLSKPHPGIPR